MPKKRLNFFFFCKNTLFIKIENKRKIQFAFVSLLELNSNSSVLIHQSKK